MIKWIVNKWDWMVYGLAVHSIRRICERNPGLAYLFELWIRDWRLKNPISKEAELATEEFYKSKKTG